ncbi:thioredoxin [Halosolutus gelatinilyticus]|uniref:thioredoxin n=1 Tax=Halosolutus gelatinilyticus TaxID=2931975 RepID=UPI001FF1AE53|nr:thioredoxin [Halosolutus gelatinilyticus]
MADADDTDTADADELDRIRTEKRERLRERIERERRERDAPDRPVHVQDTARLRELLETHSLVLVDFYADWCGPCQMLAPVLDELASDVPAAIAKVDTDANPELARQYGVQGLPTLVLFAEGDPVERLVGMQQEGRLRDVIANHVDR